MTVLAAPVALSALKGKVVAVTFIYSRCPLPDYCPRMVENFKAVRERFAARMDKDLVLLTISFDPQYDTPAVLARYAASQRAGGPGWHFLTGDKASIERVCNAFGIEYWPEEGLITHSLQTAVVDRDGRLAATVEGKDFTPQQLGDLIGSVIDRGLRPRDDVMDHGPIVVQAIPHFLQIREADRTGQGPEPLRVGVGRALRALRPVVVIQHRRVDVLMIGVALDRIGRLHILKDTFSEIITTREVFEEFGKQFPDWISIKQVENKQQHQITVLQIKKVY